MKKFLKAIYKALPFKKSIYCFIRKLYKPQKSLYQHLYFTGNFKVKVNEKKCFRIRHYGFQVENELFWNGIYGGWEKYSLQLWSELCKDANTIFDIGANTGVYALLAKSINPNANVYAFEPVDRVFEKLVYNCKLNNYTIICENKAISNSDGTATIYDKDTEHTYSVTVNKDTSSNTNDSIAVKIETIRLDSYINQNNISHADLLKIDVETHEVEALEGFGQYLKKFQPTMLIEILNDEVAHGITELIKDIDYVYFNIDEKKGIRKVEKLSKSDYYNFLICKPETAKHLNLLSKHHLH